MREPPGLMLPSHGTVTSPTSTHAVGPDDRSGGRQKEFGTQAADRRARERQPTAVERGKFNHDRQAKPRPWLGLVESPAAMRGLRPFGRSETGAVVVDQD